MTARILGAASLKDGLWRAVVSAGPEVPQIRARIGNRNLPEPTVVAGETPGAWQVSLSLPVDLLNEGVQTLLITQEPDAHVLASMTLIAGETPGDNLQAEVDLLRAELDLLKSAFRRHFRE